MSKILVASVAVAAVIATAGIILVKKHPKVTADVFAKCKDCCRCDSCGKSDIEEAE